MKQTQIFPINVKGIAGSLVVLVNWSGAWAVSYTFNFLMSWSSPGKHSLRACLGRTAYNNRKKTTFQKRLIEFYLCRYILFVLGFCSCDDNICGEDGARDEREDTGRDPSLYSKRNIRRKIQSMLWECYQMKRLELFPLVSSKWSRVKIIAGR